MLRRIQHPQVARWSGGALALFMLAVGFMLATQVRTRHPIRQAGALPSWRLPELAVLIRQQEEARRLLEAEVEELRRRSRDYEAAILEGRGLSQAMAREIGRYKLMLGLVPVEGPGVRVVARSEAPRKASIMPSNVEAQDLSGVANELWAAGAEAMAINGVRVLATTGIRSGEGAIYVGTVAIAPPYIIEAIGDPSALEAALTPRGGFVEGLRSVGIQVTVSAQKRLRLPARDAAEPLRYARPKSPN